MGVRHEKHCCWIFRHLQTFRRHLLKLDWVSSPLSGPAYCSILPASDLEASPSPAWRRRQCMFVEWINDPMGDYSSNGG